MAKSQRSSFKTDGQNISSRIFDDVLALVGTLVRSRKDFGADKLHSLAEATREYAASMTDLPNLRTHVSSAAESIEGLSEYVMHTDVEHMMADAGTFARRHPFATLGVTVAAGVVVSRYIRPSPSTMKTSTRKTTAKARRHPVQTPRGKNGSAHA